MITHATGVGGSSSEEDYDRLIPSYEGTLYNSIIYQMGRGSRGDANFFFGRGGGERAGGKKWLATKYPYHRLILYIYYIDITSAHF